MSKTFVDINYYTENIEDPKLLLDKYSYNLSYLEELPISKNILVYARIKKNALLKIGHIKYFFIRSRQLKKWQIPIRYHQKIKKTNPDYILVHGMGYSFFANFIKTRKYRPIILVQSNGFSTPPKGLKKNVFKWCQKNIDGYLFTGKENAFHWVQKGVFNKEKVFEVMEGTTNFRFNSSIKKRKGSFLWVGRLDTNKDPITVLKAFEKYVVTESNATLDMIYSATDLLQDVTVLINSSPNLMRSVRLLGKMDRNDLEAIYQRSQYFILGSHYEGSGYALMEAMACGCVPIITNIPSFRYMTNNGACAFLFAPEDIDSLIEKLVSIKNYNYNKLQNKVLDQFSNKLSAKAIAKNIWKIFQELESKKEV